MRRATATVLALVLLGATPPRRAHADDSDDYRTPILLTHDREAMAALGGTAWQEVRAARENIRVCRKAFLDAQKRLDAAEAAHTEIVLAVCFNHGVDLDRDMTGIRYFVTLDPDDKDVWLESMPPRPPCGVCGMPVSGKD